MIDDEKTKLTSGSREMCHSNRKADDRSLLNIATFRGPWKVISSVGVLLGIIASVIAIHTYLKVDQLELLAIEAQNWAIDVKLDEPDRSALASRIGLRVTGKVELRTAANENKSVSKINLSLYQKKVGLICLVRPIVKKQCLWYRQASPVIYPDGSFEFLAFLSDKDADGLSIEHQIIALAVPKEPVVKTLTYQDLPFYLVASRIVSIKGR